MQTQIAQMSDQQLLAHIKQLTESESQHQQLIELKNQLEQLNHQRADGFYLHCVGLALIGLALAKSQMSGSQMASSVDVAKGLEVISQAEQLDRFTAMMAQAQHEARSGQFQQAIKTCEYVDKQQPNHPKAMFMLAQLSARQGLLERSCEYLRRGLIYSPYHLNLLNMLLGLYVQLHNYEQALDISNRMVKLQPKDLRLALMHAQTLVNCGRSEQALAAYEQAAKIGSEQGAIPAQVKVNQGHIHRTLGNTNLAIDCYLDCLDSNEYFGSAYWALANIDQFSFSPEHVKQLEDSQLDVDVDQSQSCQAGFALARYHESQQQYKQAFMAYQGANFNRPGSHFNSEKHAALFNSIIASFNHACFERDVQQPTDSVRPIFIVGLPRSGSTLIEQILASHSLVEGTGELKTLPSIAKRVFQHSCMLNGDSSGSLSKFSNQDLARFGQMYLDESKIYRTDKPYFIDKLPPNFHHVGLIKLILPDAIVIDARRQPLACGLGIFRQYFAQGHDFAYNLNHIGFYYNQYLKLMDHWDKVLPDFVLCVQYEQLLAQFEPMVKHILDHCGLAFEQQCLNFYQTERAVHTASSSQVRQPLNRTGLELWQHYQQQLAPLKKALTESTVQRFKMWL